MSHGEWHVSARVRWFWGLLTALVLLVLAVLAVLALIAAIDGNGYALVVFLIAVPPAYLAGRASSRIPAASLTIAVDEIVIVGPLRTFRVPINHADAFIAEARPSILGPQPTIALRYDGFRSIGLWLFTRYASQPHHEQAITELAPLTKELNEALAKAK